MQQERLLQPLLRASGILASSGSPNPTLVSPLLLRGLAFEEFGFEQADCSVGLRESLKGFLAMRYSWQ